MSAISAPKPDPRDALRRQPMSPGQLAAVALCVVINMLDGFDILVSGFTAPMISKDWGLAPTQLGLLLSASLAGMTAGALGLSPLADVWGRRRMVLAGLAIVTAGMLAAASADSFWPLVAARALTGAGVGGMMATINTVVAECANDRRRDLAVCLQACGFPLGGMIGGFAVFAFQDVSWQSVYAAGAIFSAVLAPLVLKWMPESLDFLVERRPRDALVRLNAIARRFGLPTLEALPAQAQRLGDGDRAGLNALQESTALICACFFLLMFSFYFLTSWTPKLLTNYGFSMRLGVSGAVFMNMGGVVGDLVFAALTMRWPAHRLGPIFLLLTFLTAVMFAVSPLELAVLLPLTFALGFLLYGSIASLYAMAPVVFPARLRTSGTGLALGLGRIGATAGPYVGGLIIAVGWDRTGYLLAMATPLIGCAALSHRLSRGAHFAQGAFASGSATR